MNADFAATVREDLTADYEKKAHSSTKTLSYLQTHLVPSVYFGWVYSHASRLWRQWNEYVSISHFDSELMCEGSPQGSNLKAYNIVFCVKIESLVILHLLTCNSLLHKQWNMNNKWWPKNFWCWVNANDSWRFWTKEPTTRLVAACNKCTALKYNSIWLGTQLKSTFDGAQQN